MMPLIKQRPWKHKKIIKKQTTKTIAKITVKQKFQHKIVNIFLPIIFSICFGVLKRTVSLRRFVPTTYILVFMFLLHTRLSKA